MCFICPFKCTSHFSNPKPRCALLINLVLNRLGKTVNVFTYYDLVSKCTFYKVFRYQDHSNIENKRKKLF